MTNLHRLYDEQGQSPWLDNITRTMIDSGQLAERVDQGVRGVTSNPTIFQKAMTAGDAYDEQFADLLTSCDVEDAYWAMAVTDVSDALSVLRPVHDAAGGADGFVSIEVSPRLAKDTDGTIASARDLHERIDRPNLMVKIPATREGVPAIHQMVAEGRNINVTLIFGLERYGEVIEAYLSGLEAFVAGGGNPSSVHGVGSFFVSRVDTEVDRRLLATSASGGAGPQLEEPRNLLGKAAVAQAQLAYQLFLDRFSGPRWEALAGAGANVQRPLWASTSTKNPHYPDLIYVDSLIGPNTVNTLPEPTLDAFADHGTVERTVDADPKAAAQVMDRLAEQEIDLADVADTLEREGVASFTASYGDLLDALSDKAAALR